MVPVLRSLWKDESGQGLTEYALLTGAVASMVAALAYLFRGQLGTMLNTIGSNVQAKAGVVNT